MPVNACFTGVHGNAGMQRARRFLPHFHLRSKRRALLKTAQPSFRGMYRVKLISHQLHPPITQSSFAFFCFVLKNVLSFGFRGMYRAKLISHQLHPP